MDSDADFDPDEEDEDQPTSKTTSRSKKTRSDTKLVKSKKTSSETTIADVNDTMSLPIVYECSLCHCQMPWKNKLKRHYMGCFKKSISTPNKTVLCKPKITTGARFRCEYCSFMSTYLNILSDHKKDEHSEEIQSGVVECGQCSLTFFSSDEWKMHMKLHNVDSETTINNNNRFDNSKNSIGGIESEQEETVSPKNKRKLGGISKPSYPGPMTYCTSVLSSAGLLEKHMQRRGFKRKFSADLPQVYLTDDDLLFCIRCGYKTITEFHMQVHRILCNHSLKKNVTWKCPKNSHCFQSHNKLDFLKHVQEVHELKEEDFTLQDFGELKMMDCQPSTATGEAFNCNFCDFSARLKFKLVKHVQHNHPKRQCGTCKKRIQGDFQMFWHKYAVHKKVSDYDSWRLQCTICSYENSAKNSYQHGGTHNKPVIKFKTIFQDKVKGIVSFMYSLEECTSNAEADNQINTTGEGKLDNDDSEACSLYRSESENEEQLDEVFTASDKESSSGEHRLCDPKFSCKSCHFTTENSNYLCMHEQMYHKSVNQTHFVCPQPNCIFESQYRSNFRRHLLRTHELSLKDFEISNRNTMKPMLITESLTCEKCLFEAGNSKVLSMHVQLLHSVWQRTDADPFRCPVTVCGFTSPYKTNFKRHLMRAHSVSLKKLGIVEVGPGMRMHKAPSTFEANNDDASEGERKFAFKKHLQKRMEVKEDEAPRKELKSTEWKMEYACAEPNCCSKFPNKSEYFDHYLLKHGDFGLFWKSEFPCPFENCPYVTKRKINFKKHLTLYHQLNDSKLQEWKGIDNFISKYVKSCKCLKCGFDGKDMKELRTHFRKEHWSTELQEKAKPVKKNLEAAAKCFSFKCTQCKFGTNSKPGAYYHGLRHFKTDKKQPVVFRTYTNSKQQKDLVFRFSNENLRKCPACDFKAIFRRDLSRHMLNFHSLEARNHASSLKNIRITEQRTARREELRQKIAADIEGKELCKIMINQNKQVTIDSDSALDVDISIPEKNNELIKIVVVDDTEECTNDDDYSEQVNPHNGELVCTICDKQFLGEADLLTHINTVHIPATNKRRIETGKVPPGVKGKISFICCVCKQVLFCTGSLKNHTNIHAKAAKDFSLTVTFRKFIGGMKLNKVKIKADPNFVPRKSSYVRWAPERTPKDKDPVLDYDPKLTVFSCDECNFKTNEEENLIKHKKLHWNKEKEEMYKTKNWFNCEACSYYCLDADRLKEHAETHKSRTD